MRHMYAVALVRGTFNYLTEEYYLFPPFFHLYVVIPDARQAVGYLRQLIIMRGKKVDDVALWQPVLLISGMTLWLIYGIMLKEMPMILANSFAITCNVLVLIQKFIYKGNG